MARNGEHTATTQLSQEDAQAAVEASNQAMLEQLSLDAQYFDQLAAINDLLDKEYSINPSHLLEFAAFQQHADNSIVHLYRQLKEREISLKEFSEKLQYLAFNSLPPAGGIVSPHKLIALFAKLLYSSMADDLELKKKSAHESNAQLSYDCCEKVYVGLMAFVEKKLGDDFFKNISEDDIVRLSYLIYDTLILKLKSVKSLDELDENKESYIDSLCRNPKCKDILAKLNDRMGILTWLVQTGVSSIIQHLGVAANDQKKNLGELEGIVEVDISGLRLTDFEIQAVSKYIQEKVESNGLLSLLKTRQLSLSLLREEIKKLIPEYTHELLELKTKTQNSRPWRKVTLDDDTSMVLEQIDQLSWLIADSIEHEKNPNIPPHLLKLMHKKAISNFANVLFSKRVEARSNIDDLRNHHLPSVERVIQRKDPHDYTPFYNSLGELGKYDETASYASSPTHYYQEPRHTNLFRATLSKQWQAHRKQLLDPSIPNETCTVAAKQRESILKKLDTISDDNCCTSKVVLVLKLQHDLLIERKSLRSGLAQPVFSDRINKIDKLLDLCKDFLATSNQVKRQHALARLKDAVGTLQTKYGTKFKHVLTNFLKQEDDSQLKENIDALGFAQYIADGNSIKISDFHNLVIVSRDISQISELVKQLSMSEPQVRTQRQHYGPHDRLAGADQAFDLITTPFAPPRPDLFSSKFVRVIWELADSGPSLKNLKNPCLAIIKERTYDLLRNKQFNKVLQLWEPYSLTPKQLLKILPPTKLWPRLFVNSGQLLKTTWELIGPLVNGQDSQHEAAYIETLYTEITSQLVERQKHIDHCQARLEAYKKSAERDEHTGVLATLAKYGRLGNETKLEELRAGSVFVKLVSLLELHKPNAAQLKKIMPPLEQWPDYFAEYMAETLVTSIWKKYADTDTDIRNACLAVFKKKVAQYVAAQRAFEVTNLLEEHKLSAEELKEVLPATESWPMDFSQAHVLIKYLLDNHSENAPEIRHACDNTITARIIDLIADNKLDKIKTLKEHFNLGDQKWGDLLPHNFSQIAYFIASTLKTGKPYIYPLLDKAQQAYEQDPNSTDSVHSLDQLVAEAFTGNKALANLLNCITVTPNNFDSILSSQPINVLFASGAMKTLADHFKIGTSIEASSYDFAFYVAMSNYIKILLENRRTADIQQLVAEFTPNLENLTHIQVCFNQLSGFFWSTLKNHGTLPLTFYQYVFFSAQDVCGFIHETATTPDERYRVQHGLLHSGILAYALSDKSNLNSSDKDDILTDWQLTLKTYISTEALERSVEDVVQLIQQVKALHPLKFKTEVELFTPEVLTATDYAKQLTQHYIEALLTQKQWGTLGELAKYDSLTTSNLTTIISNYLKDQATNTENWGWINIAIIELTKHDHIDESFIMDHVCQTVVDEVNKNHNDYHGFPLLETLGIDQDIVDSAVTKLQEALATGDYDACYKAFKIANQSREARKLLCNHFLEMTSLKQLSDIKDLSDFKEKLKTPHNKLIALKDSEFFTYLQGSHPSIMTLIDAFEDNAELWEKLIEASSALEAETDKEENGSPVYLHDFIIPRDLTDNKYWYIPQAVAKKIGDDIAQIPYSILERPFYNSFVGVDKALENDTHSLEFLSDDGLTYELQTASSSNLVLLLTGASSHARSTTPPSLTGTSPARFPTTPSFTGTSPARFSETPPSPMRVDTPPQQQPAASPVSQMSLSTGDSSSGSEANATPTPPSPGFNVSFFSERSGEDYPFPTKPGQFNSKAFDSQINLLAHWVNLALIAVNDHSDISSYMENPPLKEQLINVATNNTKLKKCYTLSFDALAQEAESSWKIGARELTDKAIARLLGFDPTAADLVIKTDPKGKQRDIKFQEAVTATINLKALLASIRYQDPTITALWLQLIVTTHCALIPKASKTHEKNLDRFQKKLQAAFTTGDLKGILQAGVAPHEIENAKAILQKALPVQEKRHGITTNRDGTQKFPATIDALLERYSRALTKSEKFGLKTRLRVEHPQSDTSRYAARRRASQRASGSSLITTGKQEPAAPLPPAQKTVSILTSENPTNIWSAANIEIDDFNFDARSEIF